MFQAPTSDLDIHLHAWENTIFREGLESQLSGEEPWLLFQRTLVQLWFPAPTWGLTTACQQIHRGSDGLFLTSADTGQTHGTQLQAKHLYTRKKWERGKKKIKEKSPTVFIIYKMYSTKSYWLNTKEKKFTFTKSLLADPGVSRLFAYLSLPAGCGSSGITDIHDHIWLFYMAFNNQTWVILPDTSNMSYLVSSQIL